MPIIAAGAGIAGSIINGIQGASAAGKASDTLAKGATQSEHIVNVGTGNAANFLQDQWNRDQNRQNPYLSVGSTSANALKDFLSKPFQAPTLEEARNSPGYQFELEQGTDAINKNAAATGTLLSGNTGAALEKFGTGLADSTYNDLYNRALSTYTTNLTGLFGGAQLGESAASTLGAESVPMAANFGDFQMRGAEDAAQQNNNIAQARASGYLGKANAYSNMINGITNGISGIRLPGSGGSFDDSSQPWQG
jgi:hypothetical protein